MLRGRDDERARIGQLIADARHQHSGTLVIRGEPGVGKSTLLGYAAQAATGMRVLRGSGVEAETRLPFAILHQLLYPVRRRVDDLPSAQRGAVRAALGFADGHDHGRFLVAAGVLTLLGELAVDGGLLCLVDDAHWLDEPSADALVFCARRLEAEGVALLFAARDFPAPFRGLPQLEVGGLPVAHAERLLADRAPGIAPPVCARLVDLTAGNPLALAELPALLTARQLAGRDPLPDPMPIGPAARRLFTERLARLSAGARRLLEVAAVDDSGDLRVILTAAGTGDAGLTNLHEAEQAGLVEVRDGRLVFRHPLMRSATYHDATFGGQRAAHLALAAALDPVGQPDRIAWHRAAAAVGPDEEVAAARERSAARAMSRGGAPAAAAAWERSAALSPRAADQGRRLVEAAYAWWTAGRAPSATSLLREAEPLVDSAAVRSRLLHLRGLVELRCGMPDAAYPVLIESAAAADPPAAARTLVLAAESASFNGNGARVVEVGALASRLAGDPGPDPLVVRMLTGTASIFAGEWAAGAEALREVVAEAERLRDPEALLWAGRAAFYLGDQAAARTLHQRSADLARAAGALGVLTISLDRLAFSHLLLGRVADAEAAATEGMRLATEIGQDEAVVHHLGTLTAVYAIRGDEAAFADHADRAGALVAARDVRLVGAMLTWARGLLDLGLGRPQNALDHLAQLGGGTTGHPAIRLWATPDLAEAAARAGRPEEAADAVDAYGQWARRTGMPSALAAAARCRALAADPATAGRHYEEALRLLGEAEPRPYDEGRTRLLYGELLRRGKQRSRSRTHLRAAVEAFERLGAERWADRARRELRASGETARRRTADSVTALTPQELQIARLASQGASNPDIAAAVFLSRRTVEYHLHKVFTKLGVVSRAELATLELEPA
ncbi:MAG TPA: AAA family ATPase [Actinoplanes sp.]|nr:AAA family ATPase [Actinoplanes sp.]